MHFSLPTFAFAIFFFNFVFQFYSTFHQDIDKWNQDIMSNQCKNVYYCLILFFLKNMSTLGPVIVILCKCTAEVLILRNWTLRYFISIVHRLCWLSESAGSYLWYISWWIFGTNICSAPSKESEILDPIKYFSWDTQVCSCHAMVSSVCTMYNLFEGLLLSLQESVLQSSYIPCMHLTRPFF